MYVSTNLTNHSKNVNQYLDKKENRVRKLIKNSDVSEEKSIELVMFAVDEFKAKSDYSKLKEYGELLGVDIEKLGFYYRYYLNKKEYNEILKLYGLLV